MSNGGNGKATGWYSILLQGGSFALVVYMIVVAFPATHKEVEKDRLEIINTLQEKFEQRNAKVVASQEEIKATLARIEAALKK
jgi:hypothetical protein